MEKLLGGLKRGLVFVVSAPSGTGKSTLVNMLYREFNCVKQSISYTTRKPRSGEVDGRDYHFITHEAFEKKIEEGDFLEYAKVYSDYYGTSHQFVKEQQEAGFHVILVIDTQGALQLMKSFKATFIFISPPNMDALRTRLNARLSDTNETIEKRLSWAEKEISLAPRYDYHIINDDLQIAYTVLKSIFIAVEHKSS